MSHNVTLHQIMQIPTAPDERHEVRVCIESANSFVLDNYSPDDQAAYISMTHTGVVLMPLRTDIVGNLLVYISSSHRSGGVSEFIANLRRALGAIGLRFQDCAGGPL